LKQNNLLNSIRYISINLTAACGYFIFGYLGTLLATPPSHASPVWPASGFALAVALVYGKRIVPGLFIGTLILQIYSFLDFSLPENILPSLITGAFSSLGSSLQAFLGAYLVNHYCGKKNPFIEDRKIFNFFVFGGFISCFIAPTLGIATIYFQGFITVNDLPISWFTWWIGDVIGVIIFAPIILSLIAEPVALWKERRKLVSYPLICAFLLVVGIFQYNQTQEIVRIASAFERQTNVFNATFSSKIQNYVGTNEILRAFYNGSQHVTKEEFSTLTQPFIKKFSSIQALEWILFIPKKQRHQFEDNENYGLMIREPNQEKDMVSAKNRDEYFPITYVQPQKGNERALGFDVGTNPSALPALLKARDTGKTAITEPIQLVQDLKKKTGSVLYSPVYRKQAVTRTIAERKNALRGFVAGVFRAEDEIKAVFSQFPNLHLLIKIEDSGHEFYSNFPDSKTNNFNLFSLVKVIQLPVANRIWTITYQPSPDFYHNQITWALWWILLGGLITVAFTGMGLLMLTGRALRTEELVRIRTDDLAKSEERWQFALEGSRDGVWDWNIETNEVFFSTNFKSMLGFKDNEMNNHLDEWDKRIHPDDKKLDYTSIKNYLTHNATVYENEHRLLCKDGTYKWVLARGKVVSWTDEKVPLRMIGTHMDITARKLAEEKLQLSAKVFSETNEGITITDAKGIILDVNPAFSKITGYTKKEVIGKNSSLLGSGKHSPDFYSSMWQTINKHGYWQGEIWNRKKEGAFYAELLSISSILDKEGAISHYVGIFTDITYIKKQQETLEQIAHYDTLTQLPNRVLLADRFSQALAHSKRHESLLAVCFLDLDNFKPVNDIYGHEAGDQLLVQVAERIKAIIREEDTVSRQGGDEFVLLLGDIESPSHCEKILKRTIESLAEPYMINKQSISISASVGVSLYPIDNSDLDTLMRHADQAMYQAKLDGRNRYNLFNTEQDQIYIQKNIKLKEIQYALENDELCLYYQPKVNMATGKVFGAEALIRWNHPEKGLIPPLEFLPVIEGTELEIQIGHWVINQALAQLSQWQEQGIELEISVNISSYHLLSALFVDDFEKTLSLYPKVHSKFLQLEILESSALGDIQLISNIMKICTHALGVNIALDDFGTGYSSLTHLRNLPIEVIKIDQTFISHVLDDPNDYAIIDSVIGLADSFNRNVIAEGVETTQHGLMLLLMGCENAQGYGIARPMPVTDFSEWLNNYRPNQDWIDCANKPRTQKENKLKIFQLTFAQWQKNFETRIQAPADTEKAWPILIRTKCHCGVWIKRARQEMIFEEQSLLKLEKQHDIFHDIADDLFQSYQEGNISAVSDGLKDFKNAVEHLYSILGQCE